MEYIQYIKPELLTLIPVLLIIGKILKESPAKDNYIPMILGAVSIILSCLWVLGNSPDCNIYNAILTGVVQGILCAGAAVYGNQVFKQYRKDK